MRRINLVLKRLELDKSWHQTKGHQSHPGRDTAIERIDEVIATWQEAYDRLAGVPEREDK